MCTATICNILYADDDADDQAFLNESVTSCGLPANIITVGNGEEAISYLQEVDHQHMPSLILLDLNMPRLNGKQTLSYLKAHPQFAQIPVVILTTSANTAEQKQCHQIGATSYFVKPLHIKGYQTLVHQIADICSLHM